MTLVLAVGVSGCLPQTHKLLWEDGGPAPSDASHDGGPSDTGGVVWTACETALVRGHHGDACTFSQAEECGGDRNAAVVPSAACISGQLLRVDSTLTGSRPIGVCRGTFYEPFHLTWIEVLSAAGGCVELELCYEAQPTVVSRISTCQVDPLPSLRSGAEGMSPWTTCEAALQSGQDGDRCEGDLQCWGSRASSNALFMHCDAGHLRVMPMASVVSQGSR